MDGASDVLIVGAGIAGLAAAAELAARGLKVTLLEARDRCGGRILTLHPDGAGAPVELGAEFIHGEPPELLRLLAEAGAALKRNFGTDACFERNSLSVCPDDAASSVLDQLAEAATRDGDMSFDDFLAHRQISAADADAARSYVEGFNAADASRIGIAALARQQQAEDEIGGDRSWRAVDGYDLLPKHLARKAESAGATLLLETPVISLDWGADGVTVQTGNSTVFHALKAIITLPLGVLQARAVHFHPEPAKVLGAADRMAAGSVQRIVLVFRRRFWSERMPQMRFLFAEGATPSTWWTQHPLETPVLTGWIGGPRAETATARDPEMLLSESLRYLERVFSLPADALDAELRSWHLHDWQQDAFSLGAYSYAPAGAAGCSAIMAEPVACCGANILFFAGEHTDITGHWGTVHGALRSGLRAARQVLDESFR